MMKRHIVALLFALTLFTSTATAQEKGMENWAPDAVKESGGWMTSVVEAFQEYLDLSLKTFTDLIKNVWKTWKDTFDASLAYIGTLFEWLGDTLSGIFEALIERAELGWKIFLEWFWSVADWLIGTVYDAFEFVMDQLPEIDFPEGFVTALTTIIDVVRTLNRFVPVLESTIMFTLYQTCVLGIIVYRHVKSWVPMV